MLFPLRCRTTSLPSAAHASLDLWLGEVIEVRQVAVAAVEATLTVDIAYLLRESGNTGIASFTRTVP